MASTTTTTTTVKRKTQNSGFCSSFALSRDDKGMLDHAIYERVIRSSMLWSYFQRFNRFAWLFTAISFVIANKDTSFMLWFYSKRPVAAICTHPINLNCSSFQRETSEISNVTDNYYKGTLILFTVKNFAIKSPDFRLTTTVCLVTKRWIFIKSE